MTLPSDPAGVSMSRRRGPAGERVVVAAAADATAAVAWDAGGATDLTGQVADVLLLGWEATAADTDPDTGIHAPPTVESVHVGQVTFTGDWQVFVTVGDGECYQVDDELVALWAQAAVTALITAGVAHESAEAAGGIPDDTSTLPEEGTA